MLIAKLTQGWSQPRLQFAPEWAAVIAEVMLDAIWARAIGFHLVVTAKDFLQFGGALGIAALVLLRRWNRLSLFAEYFALTGAATGAFAVLSYLALASSGALRDDVFLSFDRALGFDWAAGLAFLKAHALTATILKYAYNSMLYQGLYFGVLLALMNEPARLRQMFWLVLVAGLLTSLGVLLWPALGPFKIFHAAPPDSFLPEMERIRGHVLSFALGKMTGVVSFPSFHTTMALAYVWGFRRTSAIGWLIGVVNVAMLCAIPWYGGHYLSDMLGGACVFALALAAVQWLPRLALRPRSLAWMEQPA
jgi:membrane-associated phospholipid phosphatase